MKKGTDYIGVGVGAVIHDGNGKYFLSQRGKQANNERGKWEFPGGGVEFGERLEETAIREMKEEFGIDVEVIENLGVYDHIIPNEKQHWVATSFICRIKKGKPQIMEQDKISNIGWFTIEEAENLELSILGKADINNLKKKYAPGRE